MLTPQEIAEKPLSKVRFGGYDMGEVDDFLELVGEDYASLYKENAILKGKLKVLVEKIEEYRTTEDSMRMALLTAQKVGENIKTDADKKREAVMRDANEEIKAKLAETAKRVADEELRLSVAAKETAKFIELSQAIMQRHSEFLTKLEGAICVLDQNRSKADAETVQAVATSQAAATAVPAVPPNAPFSAVDEPSVEHVAEPVVAPVIAPVAAPVVAPVVAPPMAEPVVEHVVAPVTEHVIVPAAAPAVAPAVAPPPQVGRELSPSFSTQEPRSFDDQHIFDVADQIDSAMQRIADLGPPVQNVPPPMAAVPMAQPQASVAPNIPAAYADSDVPPMFRQDAHLYDPNTAPTTTFTPQADLEVTSPRPKFDFDDLRFGDNF